MNAAEIDAENDDQAGTFSFPSRSSAELGSNLPTEYLSCLMYSMQYCHKRVVQDDFQADISPIGQLDPTVAPRRGSYRNGPGNDPAIAPADPVIMARMLVALLDGLQIQWLLDDDLDVASTFSAMVELLFPPTASGKTMATNPRAPRAPSRRRPL